MILIDLISTITEHLCFMITIVIHFNFLFPIYIQRVYGVHKDLKMNNFCSIQHF